MEGQNRKNQTSGALSRDNLRDISLSRPSPRHIYATNAVAIPPADINGYLPGVLLTVIIILSSLLTTVVVQAAEIYKWVDENGKVHFGDRPEARTAEKIIIHNSAHGDTTYQNEVEKQTKLLEVYTDERQEQQQLKEKAREDKATRVKNCNLAKNNLAGMKTASFLYEPTKDPFNPRVLSQAERGAETAKAEAAVQQWCK
ncbi:MAG: hypothetical protein HW386_284 [Gammaproteobacteria bacterium]|nr:hypothetical protein [Gammaproteobacteria bacterium]